MYRRESVRDHQVGPGWLRKRLGRWPLPMYALGLGFLVSPWVMVLTTRGRKTGQARRTPLWYDRQGDVLYCLSGWGASSDWLRNVIAHPEVSVQVGRRRWTTRAMTSGIPSVESVLPRFRAKYAWTVPLFYHLDRLVLVAFPTTQPQQSTPSAPPDQPGQYRPRDLR